MLALPALLLSLFIIMNGFRMPSLPLPHLRSLPSLAISTRNKPESIQDRTQLKKALRSRFHDLIDRTDFAVGGTAIMPDPCLAIQSFGKFNIATLRAGYLSDLKALSTFASLAEYGLGSETIINLEVRNTLQVDASKIEITNPNWALSLHDLIGHIGKDMNFELESVEPKLYKLLICCPGGHFKAPVDNEKHDGMFGTLMIELYGGGELAVSHCGTTKTLDVESCVGKKRYRAVHRFFKNEKWFEMKFLAHYADCKHGVREVSSGYRLALIYSLCWTEKCENAPTTKTTEISNDITRHLSSFDGCLGYLLDHHYCIASLAKYGARALKGNDQKVFGLLTTASSILKSQAPATSDKLIIYIVKASRKDYDGAVATFIGEPEVRSYKGDVFAIDGSEPSERDLKALERFRISKYEDIINHIGPDSDDDAYFDDHPDSTINDRFWRDEYGGEPMYDTDYGEDSTTWYTTFILTFWRENWSKKYRE